MKVNLARGSVAEKKGRQIDLSSCGCVKKTRWKKRVKGLMEEKKIQRNRRLAGKKRPQ